jgi:oligopeptidase B
MNKPDLPARGPIAPRRPSQSHHHGIDRDDDYAWLRADNWQVVMRDPAVLPQDIRAHLEAENAFTKAAMGDTEALQETLFAEMKGRIKEDDSSVPAPDGPFCYYTRFVTGGQQPLFCRRPRGCGEETILIDGNALAEGHAYFRIAQVAHSPDHKRIA